jgi:hypothetical protein
MASTTLRCAECGLLLDDVTDVPESALWYVDADGHVVSRGSMGDGHVRELPGDRVASLWCPGPVLPTGADVIDLRDRTEVVVEIIDDHVREPIPFSA